MFLLQPARLGVKVTNPCAFANRSFGNQQRVMGLMPLVIRA